MRKKHNWIGPIRTDAALIGCRLCIIAASGWKSAQQHQIREFPLLGTEFPVLSPRSPVSCRHAGASGIAFTEDDATKFWGAGGSMQGVRNITCQMADPHLKKVDVVLRPSLMQAETTVDLESIYPDEIIFKDIDVLALDRPH